MLLQRPKPYSNESFFIGVENKISSYYKLTKIV